MNKMLNDSSDYPEFVTRFYDVILEKAKTSYDLKFYMKKILETKGSILEIGVGTGRIFKKGVNSGADIYGIDKSQNMIAKLKENLDQKYHSRVDVQDGLNLNLEKNLISSLLLSGCSLILSKSKIS